MDHTGFDTKVNIVHFLLVLDTPSWTLRESTRLCVFKARRISRELLRLSGAAGRSGC